MKSSKAKFLPFIFLFFFISCNTNKRDAVFKTQEASKEKRKIINNNIEVITDKKGNIAFFTDKTKEGYLKMYVFQTDGKKDIKIEKFFNGTIRSKGADLIIENENTKRKKLFTVDVKNYKKSVLENKEAFLGVGISEHKGLFVFTPSAKKKINYIDDVIINKNISKTKTLAKLVLSKESV